jgi:hypothetical protein
MLHVYPNRLTRRIRRDSIDNSFIDKHHGVNQLCVIVNPTINWHDITKFCISTVFETWREHVSMLGKTLDLVFDTDQCNQSPPAAAVATH